MEIARVKGYLLIGLLCIFITFQATAQSNPSFLKKASNPLIGFKEKEVNFTWVYSNHSSKRIYFGIWNDEFGIIDPSLLTVNIYQNDSISLHPNSKEFNARRYLDRVRWVGDVYEQTASFELSNIQDKDEKDYGIEVDFYNNDDKSSWTHLDVKAPSVFTFGPESISSGKGQTANFTWKYSLNDIDTTDLTLIKFGVYSNAGLYLELCTIQVQNKMAGKTGCSSSRGRAHISALDAVSRVAFVLSNVNLNDEAVYSITLTGTKTNMESKTKLFVTDPPKVTTHPQGTTIIEGKTLNLTCLATGKPEPIITWYKDGHLIKGKPNGIIVIIKTKRTEDGTYQCFANNTVGADRSSTARVNVLYAPTINSSRRIVNKHVTIGDKATLRCPAIANPKATFKWIVDGVEDREQNSDIMHVTITSEKDYKNYVCIATNKVGQDNVTFVLKQVGPPATPRVDCEQREDTTKSISKKFHWNAPDDNGGAPIITYHVKYRTVHGRLGRGPWKYINVSHTDTWYKLVLDWSKTFEVTVTAWNIYGESPMDSDNTCAVTVAKDPNSSNYLPRTTPKIGAAVKKKPQSKSPLGLPLYIGVGVGFVVLVVIIAVMIRRRNAKKKRTKNNWAQQHISFNGVAVEGNFWESPSNDKLLRSGNHSLPRKQAMVGSPCYHMDPEWQIPNDKICVLKVIGNGAFGLVYKGRAHIYGGWSLVAIKSPYADATDAEVKDLMKEFELLKTLKPHPHVIKLLGCGEQEGRPLVIIEYVPFGDLLGYLRKSRGENDDYYSDPEIKPNTNLSSQQLIRFGWHVADGMAYLASEKIIHRDLAARNVLVGEGLSCKITDFGMAKDVSNDDIYVRTTEGRLPVKWTAIEALTGSGEYTTQSDVWSFGVVLYEICTIGADPYPGIIGKEIPQRLETGYRMSRPHHVDTELYEIMMSCWETNPADRLTFPELKETLMKLEEVESRDYINLSECLYQNVNQTIAITSGMPRGRIGSEKGADRGTCTLTKSNDYHIRPGILPTAV